jgi:chromosome segregation ATPase
MTRGTKSSHETFLREGLENTLTERDILRKTVNKLKAETRNQDMALSSLHKELENSALEQQKSKEKLRKRKERIEELQQQLKEQRDRFENREKIIYDNEQKLSVKNMQIRELNDRIEKLVEENKRQRGLEGGSRILSTRLEQTEEENQTLRTRVNELLKSKADAENKNHELMLQIQELEEHFEHEHGDNQRRKPPQTEDKGA